MRVPRLHVVCPDPVLVRPEFPEVSRAVLAAGAAEIALHLRPRRTPARDCLPLARDLAAEAAGRAGWLVVNGRVDLAIVARAQGVQLGEGALPAGAVRRLISGGTAIGASVHAAAGARAAARDGADFLLVGTIFPTPSHPGRPAAGPARIGACATAGPPVIAIGGIDADRVGTVLRAGAHGVAVIRAVWEAAEPARAAGLLLERLLAEAGEEIG